ELMKNTRGEMKEETVFMGELVVMRGKGRLMMKGREGVVVWDEVRMEWVGGLKEEGREVGEG
ncbi:hypothetical protein, partial [Micrococcus luteus]|uniref:hypothetical protein n=1 Tax=Micrococcus luteus TaxID=1270 RepID=UPI001C92D9D4